MNASADTFRIALVGHPNCGKTSLFNVLTGSRQKVANYPGVTVEKKEGSFTSPGGLKVSVVDLPGAYSLRARSPDEQITRDAVLGRLASEPVPDALVCVADSTNLRLGLRLVLELKQTGRPVVLVLNMADIASKRGYTFDVEKLSQRLGIPVVQTVAVKKGGVGRFLTLLDVVFKDLELRLSVAPEVLEEMPFSAWQPPTARQIRSLQAEVEDILKEVALTQGRESVWTKRIDRVVLHPVAGVLVLLGCLFLVFQAVFTWAAPAQDAIETGFMFLQGLVVDNMAEGPLRSLLADGLIAGVGSVLVFLPQILLLFLFILILENSGYMARAVFLLDKLMGGVGLHGRAFIPLLSSFACAIPGVMAARTIENPRDRLITILISPLMTCAARIPVYTLIIAAFVPSVLVGGLFSLQGLVMFGLYAAGIVSGLGVSYVVKKFFVKGHSFPMLFELPTYKWPHPYQILLGLYDRARIFIRRAGTIIMALMIIIWFLSSYPTPPVGATGPAIEYSFAGTLGRLIEPVIAPIGFNWQIGIALIPGMAAREVSVAALGTIYALSGSEDSVFEGLTHLLSQAWSLPTALALLAWYIFAPQCASTLAVVKRETNSWKWPIVMFLYMLILAYVAAFCVFHVASFFV